MWESNLGYFYGYKPVKMDLFIVKVCQGGLGRLSGSVKIDEFLNKKLTESYVK